MDDFDFGSEKWDLIVATYEGSSWLDRAVKGLKPGGCLVVEWYSRRPNLPPAPGPGFAPNELPKLVMGRGLDILRYEDVEAKPDWAENAGRVVRMFAQKPE